MVNYTFAVQMLMSIR